MKKYILFLIYICIYFVHLVIYAQEKASAPSPNMAGTIVAIQGMALFHREGKDLIAQVGNDTFSSDTIITQEKSKVKIVLNDGNVFTIGASSKVTIESFLKREKEGEHTSLALSVGRIWVKVKTKLNGNDSFQVKTENAIAGVRGTHFSVGYNPKTKDSDVQVFDGTVAFKNDNGQQNVSKGQAGSAKEGEEPQAREMDSHEMEQSSQEGEVTILEDDNTEKNVIEQHIENAALENSKDNEKGKDETTSENEEESDDQKESSQENNENSNEGSNNNTDNQINNNNMSQNPVQHDAAATYRRVIRIFGKVIFKNY